MVSTPDGQAIHVCLRILGGMWGGEGRMQHCNELCTMHYENMPSQIY